MGEDSSQRFIPVAAPVIGEMEIAYVTEAVKSTWVSSIGKFIDQFEQNFAEFVGVTQAIAVTNGTAGLHLVLHSLGIGPGDEVLIPDLTFVATANAVLQTGATPVLVDVEPDTWCINPTLVERAITKKTRAIIPVHLYGHPADMPMFIEIAQKYGLFIIEDAAEAHGAKIGNSRVGSFGNAGIFSFYGNKIITTGEGGMITTSDPDLANRIRHLKDHGMSMTQRYFHDELAFNYRMTNIQAALGIAQLQQIETFIEKKREITNWYKDALSDLPGLYFQAEKPGFTNVFWLASIVLNDNFPLGRDEFLDLLRKTGIDTRPFFVPMHKLPHLANFRCWGDHDGICGNTNWLSERGLNLPSSCNLDRETVYWVAEQIKKIADA